MKTNIVSRGTSSTTTTIILGLVVVVIVASVLTGRKLPLLATDRSALIAVLVLGMTMCSSGIGRVAAAHAWAQPLSIVGYLLGALILLVAFAGIFSFQLPLITSTRVAILGVAILAAAKIVLSLIHRAIS